MQKKLEITIQGMHCASCEVMIERKFKKVAGVESVSVDHARGKAHLTCTQSPNMQALQNSITEHGYTIQKAGNHNDPVCKQLEKPNYSEAARIFLVLIGLYLLVKYSGLLPEGLAVTENMSYGFVFLIGIVAAMSTCIAVTGGLLLAVAAKYNERFPSLTSAQKFKPTLYFNAGRLIGYGFLGGLIGAVGSVFTLSPRATGWLTILVSIVMILLGFQLLNIFPRLRRFQPKMPKFLAHRIHDISGKDSKSAPFILGAGTFFLPCGFTQALQLYVLSQGNITTGALTMFVFALGTLPALMSISAISSYAKGAFQKHFLKYAGALVILFGVFSINNGITLTGMSLPSFAQAQETTSVLDAVPIVNGVQIAQMTVDGYEYLPNTFTVVEGVPVEWRIDGREAIGCGRVIVMPQTGLTQYLSPSKITSVRFTPEKTGNLRFNCSMGMMTRGSQFTVVPNDTGVIGAKTETTGASATSLDCDPTIMQCNVQKVTIDVSRERGFYPREVEITQGVPVELTVDSSVPLGGCMSVLVIPDYNVTMAIGLGSNTTTFTPTKTGSSWATCSMGSRMFKLMVKK
jgi:uncharacterized protein